MLGVDGTVQVNVVLPSGNTCDNASVKVDAWCKKTLMFIPRRCFPLAVRGVPVFGGAAAGVPGDAVRTIRSPRARHNMVHCARLQRFVRAFKVPLSHLSN